MERPKYMWEVMNVLHLSKANTRIPTKEELEATALRRQQEIDDLSVFTSSRISDIFPPKK